MSFITITDFVGEFNISQNKYATTDYNAIITATEEAVLKDLLGEDLYLKLIADLNGSYVPQTAKYLELVNGKTYSVINGDGVTVNVNYQGIKKMLKYFTWVRMGRLKSPTRGSGKIRIVTSERTSSITSTMSWLIIMGRPRRSGGRPRGPLRWLWLL